MAKTNRNSKLNKEPQTIGLWNNNKQLLYEFILDLKKSGRE